MAFIPGCIALILPRGARRGPRGTIAAVARIRQASTDELERLRAIEHDACRAFADVGMLGVASDPAASIAELEAYRAAGNAWVAVDAGDHPIAYLLSHLVDGCAHIEQVSVASTHAHRGIGAALVDHLTATAAARGIPALTLTAFRDVPWNAPYYSRLGFEVLERADQGPELRQLIEHEARSIPSDAPRVAMRRPT
jgi:GNAT superfamily N-acetyltransferase